MSRQAALSPGLLPHAHGGSFVERASRAVDAMLDASAPRREILTRLATEGEVLAGPGTAVAIASAAAKVLAED